MTTMIGIDPHKATHTAVAISGDESVLDEVRVRACSAQVQRLSDWAAGFEEPVWAIESAGGLGYLLSQQLVAVGETVFDVPPMLAARVRLLGSGRSQKNDPNDARSVAIAALRAERLTQVRPDDHTRVLRMLVKRHRDLGRAKNKAASRLHTVLLELEPDGASFRMYTVIRANTIIDAVEVADEIGRQGVEIARELTADITRIDDQLKASKRRIASGVAASATSLTDISGVGPICAAQLIGHTGDISRFATEATTRPTTRPHRSKPHQDLPNGIGGPNTRRNCPLTQRGIGRGWSISRRRQTARLAAVDLALSDRTTDQAGAERGWVCRFANGNPRQGAVSGGSERGRG